MATTNLLASEVMDFAAARLNDASRQLYTYAVQLPFLNVALAELQEIYEANNIPVTDETSALINIPSVTGIATISFDDGVASAPFLPDDLIEPKAVWESAEGLAQWALMSRVDFLPQAGNTQISSFGNYQWATNQIKMVGANADNDIKIDYIRSLFPMITASTEDLFVQNSKSFLGNRVASLVASDIEENEGRSQRLFGDALAGLDRALTIPTKGRQRITTRRKPFRAGFKAQRSY